MAPGLQVPRRTSEPVGSLEILARTLQNSPDKWPHEHGLAWARAGVAARAKPKSQKNYMVEI